MMKISWRFIIVFMSLAVVSSAGGSSFAQSADYADDAMKAANAGRIGVMTGAVGSTYVQMGADLAAVLDGERDLRVVPMLGKGSVQNVTDLLYLKGVDVSMVQSDVLVWLKERWPESPELDKIAYLTKLHDEEVHLIASKEFAMIGDLDGKKVNVGPEGSGASLTAGLLFPFFGVEIDRQHYDDAKALAELKAGRIDAMMVIAGKPVSFIRHDIAEDDGLRLVTIPQEDGLSDLYDTRAISPDDYPNLGADESIGTVAVTAVLAVFNKFPRDNPRYQALAAFSEALIDRHDQLKTSPRHPKWREVDLAADVAGWKRFAPMSLALERHDQAENPATN